MIGTDAPALIRLVLGLRERGPRPANDNTQLKGLRFYVLLWLVRAAFAYSILDLSTGAYLRFTQKSTIASQLGRYPQDELNARLKQDYPLGIQATSLRAALLEQEFKDHGHRSDGSYVMLVDRRTSLTFSQKVEVVWTQDQDGKIRTLKGNVVLRVPLLGF